MFFVSMENSKTPAQDYQWNVNVVSSIYKKYFRLLVYPNQNKVEFKVIWP